MTALEKSGTVPTWEQERHTLRVDLGLRLRAVRKANDLTLQGASEKIGLATSTIHKIERGQVSPSFENLVKIAKGYEVSLEGLISDDTPLHSTTRMTVTRAGEGRRIRSEKFEYEMLCSSISDKKIVPLITEVERRRPLGLADYESHTGEEMILVLTGSIELHVEHYEPVVLKSGDCVYFDSTLKHGLRALEECETKIFWACTHVDL